MHLKLTIRRSSPSCSQMRSMMRIIWRASISCLRSSPTWKTVTDRRSDSRGHRVWWKHVHLSLPTLNITLISSPSGSALTRANFRGTALELKKEHACIHTYNEWPLHFIMQYKFLSITTQLYYHFHQFIFCIVCRGVIFIEDLSFDEVQTILVFYIPGETKEFWVFYVDHDSFVLLIKDPHQCWLSPLFCL